LEETFDTLPPSLEIHALPLLVDGDVVYEVDVHRDGEGRDESTVRLELGDGA
jgi:hypothetical protein